MPVKGILVVAPPLSRVETMSVGDVKYIFCDDLIVTRKAIFLDIYIPVFKKDEEFRGEEEDSPMIEITRTGEGLSCDDFILDTGGVPDGYIFELSRPSLYFDLLQDKRDYVIFESFNSKEETFEIEEPEIDLQEKLEKAIAEEDFAEAARIQSLIDEKVKK